jgi:hypothetical protein
MVGIPDSTSKAPSFIPYRQGECRMIRRREIQDGKTLAGVLWLEADEG